MYRIQTKQDSEKDDWLTYDTYNDVGVAVDDAVKLHPEFFITRVVNPSGQCEWIG